MLWYLLYPVYTQNDRSESFSSYLRPTLPLASFVVLTTDLRLVIGGLLLRSPYGWYLIYSIDHRLRHIKISSCARVGFGKANSSHVVTWWEFRWKVTWRRMKGHEDTYCLWLAVVLPSRCRTTFIRLQARTTYSALVASTWVWQPTYQLQ